jgi:hypothetical protein
MRKQQAYKELPTHSKWWPEFEAGLIAGIEIRVSMGEAAPPPCIVMPKSQLSKWEPKVLKLIASADALWRKRDQSGSGSEAP